MDGELEFSFGYEYVSESNYAMFNGMLYQTLINCDGSKNTVIGILKNFPIIHGYDASNGTKSWVSGIKNVNTIKYIEYLGDDPRLGTFEKKGEIDIYSSIIKKERNNFMIPVIMGVPVSHIGNKGFDTDKHQLEGRSILIDSESGKTKLDAIKSNDVLIHYNEEFKVLAPLANGTNEKDKILEIYMNN